MRDAIWTPSGTDVTIRWKKMGWIAPSEDPQYKKKWADFKAVMAKTIDDWSPAEEKTPTERKILRVTQFRKMQ